MALMQISIIPLGGSQTSLGPLVAEIHKFLAQQDLPYTLTDMATIIEGEAGQLFDTAARLHELLFDKGISPRVVTQIQIDDRRDKLVHLGDKIKSVQKHLQG